MGLLSFLSVDCDTNLNSEETIKKSVSLFDKASININIVAGRLDNEFYRDARTIKALKSATSRGVSIKIVFSPDTNSITLREQFAEQFPDISVTPASKVLLHHWTTVDGKHLRIERTHPDDARITPAFICKNASILTKEWDREFATLV